MNITEQQELKRCLDLAIRYDRMSGTFAQTFEFSEITIRLAAILDIQLVFEPIPEFVLSCDPSYVNLLRNIFTGFNVYMQSEDSVNTESLQREDKFIRRRK